MILPLTRPAEHNPASPFRVPTLSNRVPGLARLDDRSPVARWARREIGYVGLSKVFPKVNTITELDLVPRQVGVELGDGECELAAGHVHAFEVGILSRELGIGVLA